MIFEEYPDDTPDPERWSDNFSQRRKSMKKRTLHMVLITGIIMTMFTGICAGQNSIKKEKNTRFYDVQKKLDQGGCFYLYIDTKDLLKNITNEIEHHIRNSNTPGNAQLSLLIAKQAFDALGLFEIQDVGISVVNADEIKRVKTFIGMPEKKGIFSLLGNKTHKFQSLKYAPQNTAYFNAFDLEPAEALTLVRNILQQAGGAAITMEFDNRIARIGEKIGFDIEKTLISLDGQFIIMGGFNHDKKMPISSGENEPKTVSVPEAAFFIKAKDATLYDAINSVFTKQGTGFTEFNSDSIKGISINMPEDKTVYFSPAIIWDGTYVIISTHKDYLDKIIATKKSEKNLGENEEFKKMTKNLPEEGSCLVFVSRAFSIDISDLCTDIIKTQMKNNKRALSKLSPAMPMLIKMMEGARESGSMAAVRINDPDGIHTICNLSGGKLEGIGSAVLAPFLLPSIPFIMHKLPKKRQDSHARICRENLCKIDGAKEQWALELRHPTGTAINDSAAFLNDKNIIGPNGYLLNKPVCPSGGTYTMNDIGTYPTCSIGTSKAPSLPHICPE
jgi:hypothetical protein